MAFGLTDSGFNKKSLADIVEDMNLKATTKFGPINLGPNSVFGQIIGLFADPAALVWDLADAVYASQYALSAKGVSLDNVAELNNLSRLGATSSSVDLILKGDEGTVVPAGTQFRQETSDEIFESTVDTTITVSDILKAVISVDEPTTIPHEISITADGVTTVYQNSYTSDANTILNDLENQINGAGLHDAVHDLTAETLTITNTQLSSPVSFEVAVSAGLVVDEFWTSAAALSLNVGPISIPANTVQAIETPVVGLDGVDNLAAGVEGRNVETDDNFRVRRKQSLRVLGAATVPAMEARIVEELDGVEIGGNTISIDSVSIKDNRTDLVDSNGRPPHSFETIITYSPNDAPTRQAIADKLWEVKPAGIETFGSITETVQDSTGDDQTIKFSRPTEKYIHIFVDVTRNPEEPFPAGGEDAISQALADFGNELLAGEDCIRQRFYNSIYSVSGVKDISVFKFATTENPDVSPPDPPIKGSWLISSEPESGLYVLSSGLLITQGVVSGMVVKRDSGTPLTSVKQVLSETEFRADEDVFFGGITVEFGGFGETNIGINDSEIARFSTDRIQVNVV